MARNPLDVDEEGVPICFGTCDEGDTTCIEDCPADLRDRCMDETCTDADREPETITGNGKPPCFGMFYSGFSKACQDVCAFSTDCRLEMRTAQQLARDSSSQGWLRDAVEDIKSDRLHLPVLNNKPSPTVVNPPSTPVTRTAPPVSYWEGNRPSYSYQSYTQPQNSGSGIQINQNRPNLTEEQYLYYYGAKPAGNPLVPGQFEGESWWSRLLKEFVLRSVMYAVQVASQLAVETVGRIRWAPEKDEK